MFKITVTPQIKVTDGDGNSLDTGNDLGYGMIKEIIPEDCRIFSTDFPLFRQKTEAFG